MRAVPTLSAALFASGAAFAAPNGDDPSEEAIVVLDDTPITVAIQWDESARDLAGLVTSPKSVASTLVDPDLIGSCASLMNNQTNEN